MITLEEVLRGGAELKLYDRSLLRTLVFNRGKQKFEIEFEFTGIERYRIRIKRYETIVGAMTEFKMKKSQISFPGKD